MTTVSLSPHLLDGFRFGEGLLRKNLAGVSPNAAAARPAPGQNNILWVAGHITYWRDQIAGMLGGEPTWTSPAAAVFKGTVRAPAPSTDPWILDQILEQYDRSTASLYAALAAADASTIPAELAGGLEKLMLHELYHVGQLGTLRRIAGQDGAI